MVTSFPTKICMVEHVSNSNYYRHNHLSSPAPISVQRILVLSFAVTPGPAAQARLDADVVCLQEQLLEHTREQEVRTLANL